jgi:hypothetical protein
MRLHARVRAIPATPAEEALGLLDRVQAMAWRLTRRRSQLPSQHRRDAASEGLDLVRRGGHEAKGQGQLGRGGDFAALAPGHRCWGDRLGSPSTPSHCLGEACAWYQAPQRSGNGSSGTQGIVLAGRNPSSKLRWLAEAPLR